METFSEFIRETRKKLGLTRQEFCNLLVINPSTLYRWEHNDFIPDVTQQSILACIFLYSEEIKAEIEKNGYEIIKKVFLQRERHNFWKKCLECKKGFGIPILDLLLSFKEKE